MDTSARLVVASACQSAVVGMRGERGSIFGIAPEVAVSLLAGQEVC